MNTEEEEPGFGFAGIMGWDGLGLAIPFPPQNNTDGYIFQARAQASPHLTSPHPSHALRVLRFEKNLPDCQTRQI